MKKTTKTSENFMRRTTKKCFRGVHTSNGGYQLIN